MPTPGQQFTVTVRGVLLTRHRPTAEALAIQVKEDLEALGFQKVEVNVSVTDGKG